jgi:hypothetical protein
MVMLVTECNSGTTQKYTIVVNSTIVLRSVTSTSGNTGTFVSYIVPRQMPLLSNVVICLRPVVELTPDGQFLDFRLKFSQ